MGASTSPDFLESVLRRDRWVVLGALAVVFFGAGLYTVLGVGMGMTAMEMTTHPFAESAMPMHREMGQSMSMGDPAAPAAPGTQAKMDMGSQDPMGTTMGTSTGPGTGGAMGTMDRMTPRAWTPTYLLLMLGMWWFMMIAMMLPSVTPTVLLAASINRRTKAEERPFGATGYFLLGYLLAWLLFSVAAVSIQWALQSIGYLSVMMASSNDYLSSILLIVAGIWQFTPIKQACLRHCRSPLDLIFQQRGQGNLGALQTGLSHGAYCLGCCWFLMVLLFVGGVMNLYWIAGLAAYVMLEKIAPGGELMSRVVGALLVVVGLVLALR